MIKYILLMALFISSLFGAVKPYKIINIYNKKSKNDISICFRVDRYFEDVNANSLKPFIRVEPISNYKILANYDSVCIKGLKPESNYIITINKNLPLGKVTLDKSYKFNKKTGDYAPSFSFKESGYILPIVGDITIPLESRNLKEVEVSLYRINKNNLMPVAINYNYLHGGISYYDLSDIQNRDGYKLWSKRLKLNGEKNKKVITAIPINTMLKKAKPGLYILAITPLDKDKKADIYYTKTQSFILSDIGLFTMQGSRALHIYTKHLKDASIYKNVKLELRAKNNEVLATTVAKNGYAEFKASLLNGVGGMSAKAIYAYGKDGDFAIIDISKPPLDLTDRGDGGLEPIEGYKAFIFSNRGIFKPKSTITFHALVKDENQKIASNLKIVFKLINPEGKDVAKKLLSSDNLGHIEGNFTLSKEPGRYKIVALAQNKKPIGVLSFNVEDFVPPKIEVEIKSKPKELKALKSATVELKAKYLTGEALPNAKASYMLILHNIKAPLKRYENYFFGKIDQKQTREHIAQGELVGDENGLIKIKIRGIKKSSSTKPLALYVKSDVLDPGARAVTKGVDIFFDDKKGYIGVKAKFENQAIDLNSKARFLIVYIANGKEKKSNLKYKLIKEESHWNWTTSSSGNWRYYVTYEDIGVIKKGDITTALEPVELALDKLDWGSYRLEISDEFGDITSYRFSSGYEESKSKISPDKLPIAIDKKSYKVGDSIKVLIKPKFSGPLIVNIASNKILESKELIAKANKPIELEFKAKKEWGSSVYVLATSFRAHSKKLGASRAVGLAHLLIIDPKRYINLELKCSKEIKSKSKLNVEVIAKGSNINSANIVLMAVDRAVLNLTNFKAPNPYKAFYSKQKLGINIRDIYSDLIKSYGQHAEFSVGADEEEQINKEPVTNNRKVFALFTKVVKFKDKRAKFILDIPDYQGKLELMAVAWSRDGVGSTQGSVVVKDDISLELYMPKFLSIGDSAKILLQTKFDKKAPKGDYIFKISTNGVVDANPKEIKYTLNSTKSLLSPIVFKALKEGKATIKVEAINNNKVVSTREFKLSTRTPYPKSYVKEVNILKANSLLDIKSLIDSNSWQDIYNIKVKVSSSPLIGVNSIKKSLISYCCRCAEQTTSRAFAFLDDKEQKELVKSAIERLYELQKYDGGFALWLDSKESMWVSSYVLDFLTEAKREGFSVNSKRLSRGLDYLQNHLSRWSKNSQKAEADAYALYVLAKNKRPMLSEIEYHINNTNPVIKSASGWANLASALAVLGRQTEAKEIFKLAVNNLKEYSNYWSNYGGELRDRALLVVLASKYGFRDIAKLAYINLAQEAKAKEYLSTQEMSLILRAAKSIDIKSSKLNILVNKRVYNGKEFKKSFSNLSNLPKIKNISNSQLWYSISFIATPKPSSFDMTQNRGFSIKKEFFDTFGKKIDLKNIKQGSEIVVVLSGKITNSAIKNPLIIDLLPAGFEIENPNITGYDITTSLKWLKDISSADNQEYRDDRYISALKEGATGEFKFAYALRAVTKGKFALAPTTISDMYKPQFRAFSKNSTFVEIKDAKDIKKQTLKSNTEAKNTQKEALELSDYKDIFNSPIKDISKYTTLQLNTLRNAIFAYVGLDFRDSNIELYKKFSKFKWYKPSIKSGAIAYSKLTTLQKDNVEALLRQEKKRLGGLTLSDFYRVNTKELDSRYFKRYNKKELKILRNSLIARYGYIFKNRELDLIFKNLPWYKTNPNIDTSTIIDKKLNATQRANLDTILEVEKSLSE